MPQETSPIGNRALRVQSKGIQERILNDFLGISRIAEQPPGRVECHRPVHANDRFPVGQEELLYRRRNTIFERPSLSLSEKPARDYQESGIPADKAP